MLFILNYQVRFLQLFCFYAFKTLFIINQLFTRRRWRWRFYVRRKSAMHQCGAPHYRTALPAIEFARQLKRRAHALCVVDERRFFVQPRLERNISRSHNAAHGNEGYRDCWHQSFRNYSSIHWKFETISNTQCATLGNLRNASSSAWSIKKFAFVEIRS